MGFKTPLKRYEKKQNFWKLKSSHQNIKFNCHVNCINVHLKKNEDNCQADVQKPSRMQQKEIENTKGIL